MKRTHSQMMDIEEQYNGFSVYQGTRSKNNDQFQVLDETKRKKSVLWVSATKTYNALTSNHLVDWLNLYGTDMLENVDQASTQFSQFLFKRGNDFEKMVVDNILEKTLVEPCEPFVDRLEPEFVFGPVFRKVSRLDLQSE